jgi:hypothetical protein
MLRLAGSIAVITEKQENLTNMLEKINEMLN